MPKEYPAEFKTKIIKRYQKGESIQSLSQNCISRKAHFYDWRREYCSIKTANRSTRQKSSTPFAAAGKVEHELRSFGSLGTYQMCPCRKSWSSGKSLPKVRQPYSVYELCEALDVARGTFYNHIFRRADRSKRDQEQARLMRLVQQVFDDSAQRFGAEKIRIALTESGIRSAPNASRRSCKSFDLHSIRPDAKAIQEASAVQKQNLLSSSSLRERPNQIWGQRYYTSKSMTTGSTFV